MELDNRAAPPSRSATRGQTEDADLVRDVRAGRPRAFENMMRRYNQRLFRVARSILRDDTDAEDAVQEAWLRAFTHLDKLQEANRLGAWLARIAANEALDRLRRRGPAMPLNIDLLNEPVSAPGTAVPMPTPDTEERRREARVIIEHAVDRLPESYRTVFVLRRIEELTINETANVLAIPTETVKSRLHRADKLLREDLKGVLESTLPDVFEFAGKRCDSIVTHVLKRLQSASGTMPLPPD